VTWFTRPRPSERRHRHRVEETLARSHRTQAELLLLLEHIRWQINDLNREIDTYLDIDRGEDE
jgi:hypothetical protein